MPENTALAGLTLGIGIRHTGKSYADRTNTLTVPSATVFDAALRYRLDRFYTALNVSNLTDEAYVASCASPGSCYAGNFRRITLSIGYSL